MNTFEVLLCENNTALRRYINYRIADEFDADDVFQETVISAMKSYKLLKKQGSFKSWILAIARNKCNDYYRSKYKDTHIFLEDIKESELIYSCFGPVEKIFVNDIMDSLTDAERQILYLSYDVGYSQKEASELIGIPLGTVKSRQAAAREKFKQQYLYEDNNERKDIMKNLPDKLPEYSIKKTESDLKQTVFYELQGLSIIPEPGEKSSWALYEFFDKKCRELSSVEVVSPAEVHGIKGVEIRSRRTDIVNNKQTDITFVAQKTDDYIRYLAESHIENGVKKCFTFLDGDVFMKNWGFGDDNIGNPIKIESKNMITRDGDKITCTDKGQVTDIVGSYSVEICSKKFDTTCLVTLGHFDGKILVEQYIDNNGRTVLWRRFNRDDWAFAKYNRKWSEIYPDNEKLYVNGEVFVHWCDCISDYIL